MKKFLALLFFGSLLHAEPPKLVVMIIGDQVRADYLERFRDRLLPDGLRRFREQGVYFTQARLDHAQTVTAPGHVLFGSGLTPSESGIVGNTWYDPEIQKGITGAEPDFGHPRVRLKHFRGTSLAQRWHRYWPNGRVITLSFKDRGSLLFTGPDQDEAFWWSKESGGFRTYGPAPEWLPEFNQRHGVSRKLNYRTMPDADAWTTSLAMEILDRYRLGQNPEGMPDLLAISFSAVDSVGHRYGPDHKRTLEAFLNLDRQVAALFAQVEKKFAVHEVLWAFSSDHGVTSGPRGRVSFQKQNLPHPEWIEAVSRPFIYLDPSVSSSTVAAETIRRELLKEEGIAEIWTKEEIVGRFAPEPLQKGYWPGRSGDLWVTLKPGYIFSDHIAGTTHGQPTEEDAHVPLAFYGHGLTALERDQSVSPAAAVPTVLKLLGKSAADLRKPLRLDAQPIRRIAFGSCLHQNRPQPIWKPVLARQPDLFIFLGDNVYADTRDPETLRAAYGALDKQPGFKQLQEEVPHILATWDDHDFGEDDAGADYPMKQQSRDIFLDFWHIPSTSERRRREGIYGSETYGPPGQRVQVILLDLRTFKTKDQLMGSEQWDWFNKQLQVPADLRLVVSSIQVLPEQHPWEKWATHPEERKRLIDRLRDPALGRVILLSGDRHLGEISSDGTLFELTASGMNTAPGGSDAEPNRYRMHAKPFRKHHFGYLEILWGTTGPRVRLQLIDSSGVVRESVDLKN